MDVQKAGCALEKPNKPKKPVVGNRAYRGTENKLRIMLKHYARHGRLLAACEAADVDFSVHYTRLQSDAVYRAAFEETEQAAAQRLEDNVTAMADEGELQAALALLRRFRPHLYRERSSVEVSGSIDLVTALSQARSRMVAIDAGEDTRKTG